MDKVKINVCVRPYFHDVVEEIVRKPKFSKVTNKHYVTYKKREYPLDKSGDKYVIWVKEDVTN